MVQRRRQPALGVGVPEARRVPAGIDREAVRHARGGELLVELDVLGAEAGVAAADVEREERRQLRLSRFQRRDLGVRVGVRAPVEGDRAGRIGRVEVARPRLDRGKAGEVVDAEDDCAVAARRETDESAALARGDRAEVAVDVGGDLARDVVLPVVARPPVQILGVRVLAARALRLDENRRLAGGVERGVEPFVPRVGRRGGAGGRAGSR